MKPKNPQSTVTGNMTDSRMRAYRTENRKLTTTVRHFVRNYKIKID
jgi:hypothetical protein